jgi:phosphoribosylformylglycinamidine synthase I
MGRRMTRPRILVLRAPGTNCDEETAYAWDLAGGAAERVHINQLIRRERRLEEFQIITIPGGFSFADSLGAGKLLANELSRRMQEPLHRFVESDGLILGICNGFQALCKAGLLRHATLFFNDSGRFECRWVTLQPVNTGGCLWTQSINQPIELPVAHAEGKFVPADEETLAEFWARDQVVFRYASSDGTEASYPANPNGSADHIAGLCNEKGTVFGLMPHPERHVLPWQHPRFRREQRKEGDGLAIFRNAIAALT